MSRSDEKRLNDIRRMCATAARRGSPSGVRAEEAFDEVLDLRFEWSGRPDDPFGEIEDLRRGRQPAPVGEEADVVAVSVDSP